MYKLIKIGKYGRSLTRNVVKNYINYHAMTSERISGKVHTNIIINKIHFQFEISDDENG